MDTFRKCFPSGHNESCVLKALKISSELYSQIMLKRKGFYILKVAALSSVQKFDNNCDVSFIFKM